MSSTNGPPGGLRPARLRTRFAISWSVHTVSPLTPSPPMIFPFELYRGTPPPKKISPPAIRSSPPFCPLGGARNLGLNGLDWPKLQSECPGGVSFGLRERLAGGQYLRRVSRRGGEGANLAITVD